MSDPVDAAHRECAVFTRYLAGREPTEYVLGKYAAIRTSASPPSSAADALDMRLLEVAVRGPGHTRIADAYARIFRPASTLRRRLVLAFAILESSPGFHGRFTGGPTHGYFSALFAVAWATATFAICLIAGAALFGPSHVAARRSLTSRE